MSCPSEAQSFAFPQRQFFVSLNMASVNKVILLGRLGRDPEVRYASEGGTAICRLAVATSRYYKDRDGNRKEETEWHNVAIFGRQAEVAQQYLRKGSEVFVEGRLRTRKYTGKDGIERYSTEVICENMQLGARPGTGQGRDSDIPAESEEDFESARRSRQPPRQAPSQPAAPQPREAAPSHDNFPSDDDIPF